MKTQTTASGLWILVLPLAFGLTMARPALAQNLSPTISAIADLTVAEDTSTPAIPFTVHDAETAAASLTVTATSSNPGLVPTNNVIFALVPGGGGSNRTVTVTPLPNQFGAATINLTVRDAGGATDVERFTLTVAPVNDRPTLDPLGNFSFCGCVPQQTVVLTGITSGATNENQALTVTATSSNPNGVATPAVTYISPNSTATLTLTPFNFSGASTITVTVNDGGASNNLAGRTFTVTATRDLTPPVLVCPSNAITVTATSPAGAPVNFSVTAIDACDPNPIVTCTTVFGPVVSGSIFPPGNIAITCRAVDACGNSNSCTFGVTVALPPRLIAAGSVDGWTIGVCFDVVVNRIAAENRANYSYTLGGIPVLPVSAVLRADGKSVILTSEAAVPVGAFTVTASNIPSATQPPDTDFPNGTVSGQVLGLDHGSIGGISNPNEVPPFTCDGISLEVTSLDPIPWIPTADHVSFVYRQITGDFDLSGQAYCPPLTFPSWYNSRPGLVARPSTSPMSKMVMVSSDPMSLVGGTGRVDQASFRLADGGPTVPIGTSVPAHPSNSWLRLTRVGDLFTAYRSGNGVDWTLIAQTNTSFRPFGDTLLVGAVVGSTMSNQAASAVIDNLTYHPAACVPPIITCPSDIVVPCQGPGGTPVLYSVTATNPCGGASTVACVPPSGSAFPVGPNLVLCTATSGGGPASTCTFVVEVEDHTPPVLICPTNRVVEAQGPDGAVVNYRPTATDNCDTNVTVSCRPASGGSFPMGATQVLCVARDGSGNETVCGFTVTVVNSSPLRVSITSSNLVLRWHGRGALQVATSLAAPVDWQTAICPIVELGDEEYMMDEAIRPGQRFFRIAAAPLPPADEDGDGIPDRVDLFPGTPAGQAANGQGGSHVQWVARPEAVTGPAVAALRSSLDLLRTGGALSNFVAGFETQAARMETASELIRAGGVTGGSDLFNRAAQDAEVARTALEATLAGLEAEPDPGGPGDVNDHDTRLLNLRSAANGLGRAVAGARSTAAVLERLSHAITSQGSVRGTVTAIDDAAHTFQVDGRTLVLANQPFPGPGWAVGSTVDVSTLNFDDGTSVASSVTDVTSNPFPQGLPVLPCIELRIAPVQRFSPVSGGPYVLHYPSAYQRGNQLWLEQGMRLAAKSLNCPRTAGPLLVYSLKLDLSYTSTFGGTKNANLAPDLREGKMPAEFPTDVSPFTPATLTVTIRRQACPLGLPGQQPPCAMEVVSATTYAVYLKPRSSYASANYSETQFDLEDSPNETAFRPTTVSSAPFFFAGETVVFAAEGYAVNNGVASYPNRVSIGQGQTFAIHAFDPVSEPGLLFPEALFGLTRASGLIWPKVTGLHNGRPFSYSCALPAVVRDRVWFCGTGPQSYYRFPFQGGWPTWQMGQGNNNPAPNATHCPTCNNAFAFDFGAPPNTQILAARGGVVYDVRESKTDNCWNYIPGVQWCNSPCGGANYVKILHQDGTLGVYAHMPKNGVSVSVGDHVRRGDPIAVVGNTGCSSNPHLHFQVDPFPGAPQSTLIRFQAHSACEVVPNFPIYKPCSPLRNCYVPSPGDILFSNNKPWWQ